MRQLQIQTGLAQVISFVATSLGLIACAEATSASPCGDGESVQASGASYCVYKENIVIVGGFDCPASMRFRMDFDTATVCSDHAFDDIDVPNDICARVFVPCTEELVPPELVECQPPDNDPAYPFCAWGGAYGVDCLPAVSANGMVSLGGGAHGVGVGADEDWRDTHESCGPGVACDSCLCDRPCVVGTTDGCPPAHSGNAVPMCVPYVPGQYLNADGLCWLSCANGETCPEGMTCVGPVGGLDLSRASEVFHVCVWVSPLECVYNCTPTATACNGMDNDCDGSFDEDCAARP